MNRPRRRDALLAWAAGPALLLATAGIAWAAPYSPAAAARARAGFAHGGSPEPSPGAGDIPAPARALVQHRMPDTLRRDGVRGTVQIASNWSGEVELGSGITSVSATWTVPTVARSSTPRLVATWVGIGGYTGTTLIQAGTVGATATGAVDYSAWVEVLPTPSLTVTLTTTPGGTTSFTILPGDTVHVSVTRVGGDEWLISVGDTSGGWVYSREFPYAVSETSAEWITERPAVFTTSSHKSVLSTLADYGSTRFTDLASAAGGRSGAPTHLTPIRMVDTGGDVVSSPGPVAAATTAAGESFTDSYLAVPSRVYGQTADDTAAVELEHQFTFGAGDCPSSPTLQRAVVLAADEADPDALASAYLASYLRTGTLLTSPTSLPATTLAAIRDEGITHVYVVGGSAEVSTSVVSALESTPAYACGGASPVAPAADVQVTRIVGATPYDTALAIATTTGASPGALDLAGAYAGVNAAGGRGRYNVTAGGASAAAPAGPLETAVLTTGTGSEDAEAASTLAYASHLPILLTTPSSLSAQALTGIETLHVRQVIVLGGPLAVSDTVVGALEAHGVAVLRIAGGDGAQTAIELAECELGTTGAHDGLGWHATGQLAVARGDFYGDGLAGAVVAAAAPTGAAREPLVLTASRVRVGSHLAAFLSSAGTAGLGGRRITDLTIFGGPYAVSQGVANTMMVALLG